MNHAQIFMSDSERLHLFCSFILLASVDLLVHDVYPAHRKFVHRSCRKCVK